MLDCLTQSYPDKRLGKRVRNNGVPLYIGVLLHKFHCNWGKGYSSFSGGDRFMGFFISGFYCIRREKHKIRKKLWYTMRHKAHFCAYELLASRLSSLLDVSQCDKKRSNTLLTISALGVLKPISFQRLSCCLRYRFYDWTKSPAPGHQHATRRRPLQSPLRNANSCHVGYL